MKSLLALVISLSTISALPGIAIPANAQSQSDLIILKAPSGISANIPTQQYLDLIDGKISAVKTPQYVIHRRLSTEPVTTSGNTPLYSLYFDFYNLQGVLLETKQHNQNKPVRPQYTPPKGKVREVRIRSISPLYCRSNHWC